MSFLAPLFLFGALAVALPVVFHLIRRSSRERVPFSSLMFLQSSPPRLTRKNRLEHIFLLLLRCAVLALLALGFARPFFSKPATAPSPNVPGQKWVVLVDNSASMRREGLWPDALRKAEQILRSASAGDQVAIGVFNRRLVPLVRFDQWNSIPAGERSALGLGALKEAGPGWFENQLGEGLIGAMDLLEEDEGRSRPDLERRIFVISDFTEGTQLGRLQGYDWPANVRLVLEPLQPKNPTNAGLQIVPETEGFEAGKSEAGPKVRIVNAANSKREIFRVGWKRAGEEEFTGPLLEIYAPPGQGRIAQAPAIPEGMQSGRLVLEGDDEKFDNTAHFVPAPAAEIEVLYLGSESGRDPSGPLFYLERALESFQFQKVRVKARGARENLSAEELRAASVIFVSENLAPQRAAALRDAMSEGKWVVLLMKSAAISETLSALAGVDAVFCAESAQSRYAMFGRIDFEHPLFLPFADPRYSDFTKIHFWKHRELALDNLPEARVLARFDNAHPALVQIPAGPGSLLVLTAGWHPSDSQLALSTKFVPLLSSILEQSGAVQGRMKNFYVGDLLPAASFLREEESAVILKPDGSEAVLPAEGGAFQADAPGIYTITSVEPSVRFAVHLHPNESRTAPMALEELERLGAPVQTAPQASPEQLLAREQFLLNSELENHQKLWRWLILGAFGFLMMESWLAGRITRRSAVSGAG